MLHGMTNKPAGQLAPLAKSWLYPAELKLKKSFLGPSRFVSEGYDQTQRAWVLRCKKAGEPAKLEFELAASEDSPVINPAVVIKDWGRQSASLSVNGRKIPLGSKFRLGHRRTETSSNLIVWFECESTESVKVSLIPVGR